LQGASAFEKLLAEERGQNIRVFVVWEPVLWTDFGAPSTATLKRISDPRASQYWDKGHIVSCLLGGRVFNVNYISIHIVSNKNLTF